MPLAKLTTGASLHYEDMRPESDRLPVIMLHGCWAPRASTWAT